MSLAKTKQQVVEFVTQPDVFRALVKEAVDNRIDDDWLKRARKALAAQQAGAVDASPRVEQSDNNQGSRH